MRVLHVGTIAHNLQHSVPLIRRAITAGWDVHLACAQSPAAEVLAAGLGVPLHATPMQRAIRPTADLRAIRSLLACMRRLRPDVVHLHSPKGALLGAIGARAAGIRRRVYTVHGAPFETATPGVAALLQATERLTAALTTDRIFVSASLLSVYRARGLTDDSGAERVLGAGSAAGVDLTAWRARLPPAERAVTFGMVGRPERDKGIADALAAFALVRRRHPNVTLEIVAPEAEQPRDRAALPVVRDGAAVPGVTVIRRFLSQADLAAFYERIDVLVLPSAREGFPTVVLEAAAMGRPTIGYHATGTVDAIVNEQTGAIVRTRDPRALAEAMERYATVAGLARAHGAAGLERVATLFRPDDVWEAVQAVYLGTASR